MRHCRQLRRADQFWVKFGQRHQHEGALRHTWVRYGQSGLNDVIVAVKQQVQVQRARGIAVRAFTASGLFNLLKLV